MATLYNPGIIKSGLTFAIDPKNKKGYSPNVHPSPTDLYAWTTSGANCTLSRDTIASPVGNTPLKMVQTGNDPYTHTYTGNSGAWRLAPAAVGETWTVSVWVKASQTIQIEGCWIASQDLNGDYLGGGGSPYPTISTEWTRISGTYTHTNASTAYVGTRLDGTPSGGAGVTIWWDGLQVERVSSMTEFNPTPNASNYLFGLLDNSNITMPFSSTFSDYSIALNGNDQYIQLPSTITINQSGGTLSGWIKMAAFDTYGAIITRLTGANFSSLLAVYSGGLAFETATNSNPVECSGRTTGIFTTSDITTNIWFNFSLVFDNSTYTIYINGTSRASGSISNNLNFDCIGDGTSFAGVYPTFLNGAISAFHVYDRALTANEVLQNYNALKGRFGL